MYSHAHIMAFKNVAQTAQDSIDVGVMEGFMTGD
jgi:hypothetical protein